MALSPTRTCDTRAAGPGIDANECNDQGGAPGTLGPGGGLTAQVTGLAGVPSGADALVANVTVANPSARSYLLAWHDLVTRPTASDINWAPNENVPNMVVVKLGTDGAIDLFNNVGSADVIVDVEGYYTAA